MGQRRTRTTFIECLTLILKTTTRGWCSLIGFRREVILVRAAIVHWGCYGRLHRCSFPV